MDLTPVLYVLLTLLSVLLGAWIQHQAQRHRSPLPAFPARRIEVTDEEEQDKPKPPPQARL